MFRIMLSTGNVFFAFVLGLAACATLLIYDRPMMDSILSWAAGFKDWVVNSGLPADYNVFVRIFLGEATLVLMGFAMIGRLVISLLTIAGSRLFGSERY